MNALATTMTDLTAALVAVSGWQRSAATVERDYREHLRKAAEHRRNALDPAAHFPAWEYTLDERPALDVWRDAEWERAHGEIALARECLKRMRRT